MTKRIVFNQPSWRIATREVEAFLTETAGHLAPVTFSLRGRKVQPFAIAPWHSEKTAKDLPTAVRVLRGDFFCLPFGGGGKHPLHGETANSKWKLESLEQSREKSILHASLRTKVLRGRVDKFIELRRGQTAIYQRHVITGMTGDMPLGHHATLRFPSAQDGGGIVSVSKFVFGQTFPGIVERPENRGYSILKPGAKFKRLDDPVPLADGDVTDLSRYPARRGFEDVALVAADDSLSFAWTAAVFPKQRYAYFALRDPKILRATMFWYSNGGRHYPPWNSRHVDVLGMEDITSCFFLGLAASIKANPLHERGIATSVRLDAKKPTVVHYIIAVAAVPAKFDRVEDIVAKENGVELIARSGAKVAARIDLSWLRGAA